MRLSLGFFTPWRVACAAAVLWLSSTGAAWAGGGGGEDAGTLSSLLCQLAFDFNVPCPLYPTYTAPNPTSPTTPIVLEIAAWGNEDPDSVRQFDFDCGNIFITFCPQLAVNATNPPAKSPLSDPAAALPFLNSLAFVSNPAPMVPLTVTQNFDPKATSQVYAVVEPGTGLLDLFVADLGGTSTKHSMGQVVAAITFPLAVLVNGATTENSVFATLQITATCNGAAACRSANVMVDLSGGTNPQLYSPAALGINFAYYSSPSPTYEVQVPLLVNPNTDPFYFLGPPTWASLPQCPNGINQLSGYCNAFSAANYPNGYASAVLKNTVVGMAPSAAPQCPGPQPGTTCPATYPSNAKQPLSPTFGFCAYLSNNAYMSNSPDAAFFLAIGTNGATYVSSPVNPAPTGVQYPACPSP